MTPTQAPPPTAVPQQAPLPVPTQPPMEKQQSQSITGTPSPRTGLIHAWRKPTTYVSLIAILLLTPMLYRVWPPLVDQFRHVFHPREHMTSKTGTYSPVTYFTTKIDHQDTYPISIRADDFVMSLPDSLGENIGVDTLRIGHNPIQKLPQTIGNLSTLKYVYIHNTRLQTLPSTIAGNTQLIELDLRGNQIRTLPDAFNYLSQLEWINLSYNRLKTLPPSFSKLTKLDILDVTGNNLTEFPRFLPPNLTELYIGGNNIPLRELQAAQERFSDLDLIIYY